MLEALETETQTNIDLNAKHRLISQENLLKYGTALVFHLEGMVSINLHPRCLFVTIF